MNNQTLVSLLENLRKKGIELSASDIMEIESFTAEEIALLRTLNKSEYLTFVINIISNRNIEHKTLKSIIEQINNSKSSRSVDEVYNLLMNKDVVEYMNQYLISLTKSIIKSKDGCVRYARLAVEKSIGKASATTILNIVTHIGQANSFQQADAALALFNNSEEMNDDIANDIIDVLYDPEVYVKFIDFYKESPQEAIEALKKMSKTFNQGFDINKTYVKVPKKQEN